MRTRRRQLRQAREVISFRRLAKAAFALTVAAGGAAAGAREFADAALGTDPGDATLVTIAGLVAAIAAGVHGWQRAADVDRATNHAIGGALLLYLTSFATEAPVAAILGVLAAVAIGRTLGTVAALVAAVLPRPMWVAARGWVTIAAGSGAIVGLVLSSRARFEGSRFVFYVSALFAALGAAWMRAVARGVVDDARNAAAREARPHTRTADGVEFVLSVRDLEVAYGSVQVLFGASLDVRPGELLALLGTNGAGKSTLLRAIAGFVRPGAGTVLLDGEDISGLLPEEIAAKGIVMVPGGRAVFPDLTVLENLRMGAFLADKAHVDAATGRIFELFPRLAERRSVTAGTLSGGEQQMLAIAQVLYHQPRVLLIDELSLGLAPTIVADLLRVVEEIASQGTAVVLVEQSVNVALSVVGRATFMEKGEVVFSGDARDLMNRPDIVRSVFLEGAVKGG